MPLLSSCFNSTATWAYLTFDFDMAGIRKGDGIQGLDGESTLYEPEAVRPRGEKFRVLFY